MIRILVSTLVSPLAWGLLLMAAALGWVGGGPTMQSSA